MRSLDLERDQPAKKQTEDNPNLLGFLRANGKEDSENLERTSFSRREERTLLGDAAAELLLRDLMPGSPVDAMRKARESKQAGEARTKPEAIQTEKPPAVSPIAPDIAPGNVDPKFASPTESKTAATGTDSSSPGDKPVEEKKPSTPGPFGAPGTSTDATPPVVPGSPPKSADKSEPPKFEPPKSTEVKPPTAVAPPANPFGKLPGRTTDATPPVVPGSPPKSADKSEPLKSEPPKFEPPKSEPPKSTEVKPPTPPANPFGKLPGRTTDATPPVVPGSPPKSADKSEPPKSEPPKSTEVKPPTAVAPPANPFGKLPGRTTDATPPVVPGSPPKSADKSEPPKSEPPKFEPPKSEPPKSTEVKPPTAVAPPKNPFEKIPGRTDSAVPPGAPGSTTDTTQPKVTPPKEAGPAKVDKPLLPRPSWAPAVVPSDRAIPPKSAEAVIPTDTKPARTDIQENYETKQVEAAVKLAKDKGLPLVVHIGADWCPPCRKMLREAWPQVEKSLNGKAIFLHLDIDVVNEELTGNAKTTADTIAHEVPSYPTVRVFQVDKSGKLTQKETISDPMDEDGIRGYLKVQGIE